MQTLAKGLERAWLGLNQLLIAATVISLIVLVCVVFGAVIMRYVFNAPLIFSFDLSTLLFAWIIFVGLVIADREDIHMGLDLTPGLSSTKLRNCVLLLRNLLVLILSVYLTWIGYQLFIRTGAQIPSLRISARWLYASMPIGFALLALSYLGRISRHLVMWNR